MYIYNVSQSIEKPEFIFSPDWSETCLDGAELRTITPYDFTCTDALTGQVTLCARRCDRIEDGCQVVDLSYRYNYLYPL